jgi:hypothetical protein
MACAYDADDVFCVQVGISAEVEHERRVVAVLQSRWVLLVAEGDAAHFLLFHEFQFFAGSLQGWFGVGEKSQKLVAGFGQQLAKVAAVLEKHTEVVNLLCDFAGSGGTDSMNLCKRYGVKEGHGRIEN